jgi:hypothetical protein
VVIPRLCHIYIDIDADAKECDDDPYACLAYYGYSFLVLQFGIEFYEDIYVLECIYN